MVMTQSIQWPTAECISWSEDGYIRLTFQRFCRLSFSQRMTITDEDLRSDLLAQDVPAFCAGYCDWIDVSTSVHVSVGWAWFATSQGAPQLLAPGGMSSNVMITSADGQDLGPTKTDELLRAWLSSQVWQDSRQRRREEAGDRESVSLH
jgi:hypothetical protein